MTGKPVFDLTYNGAPIGTYATARECANAFHEHRTLTRPAPDRWGYAIASDGAEISIKRLLQLAAA
jgi:hypothetical protein